MSFHISKYLKDFNNSTLQGVCRGCQMMINWSRNSVASHIRATCPAASPEEKKKFAKRQFDEDTDGDNPVKLKKRLEIDGDLTLLTDDKIDDISLKIESFFFRTGIPFRVADSEAFKEMVKSLNPAYGSSMPNSESLAGPLLDRQYRKCSAMLKEILDGTEHCTLISNGWSNTRGDHLVNFCVRTPDQRPFFYTQIDTSDMKDNSEAIANAIIDIIKQLGPFKFSSVITDNTSLMRPSWKFIEKRYPHISVIGCVAREVNPLLIAILKTPEFSRIISEAENVINFIITQNIVKTMYEEKRISEGVSNILSLPVSTSCLSVVNSMSDLLASKYVLHRLVDEEGHSLKEIVPKQLLIAVIKTISSDNFWHDLAKLLQHIEYPSNTIGKLDDDDAPLSMVYHYFTELCELFKDTRSLQELVEKRFQNFYTDNIGLAYMLTPVYAAKGFYFDGDQIDILGYVKELAEKTDPEAAETINRQMISYVTKMSTLPTKQEHVIFEMSARSYWNIIGRREFPLLFKIAKPIVEMICSSTAAEKATSTFKISNTRLRNCSSNDRIEKLAFIYANNAALDENDKNDYITEDETVVVSNQYRNESHEISKSIII